MPRHCVAAGCSTASGEGYSLHEFPSDDHVHAKWTKAIKLHRSGWKGLTKGTFLCVKHFEANCFVTEGVRFCDVFGMPAKKRLKPDAIPTIFPKPGDSSQQVTPGRPTSERRKRKAISTTR